MSLHVWCLSQEFSLLTDERFGFAPVSQLKTVRFYLRLFAFCTVKIPPSLQSVCLFHLSRESCSERAEVF